MTKVSHLLKREANIFDAIRLIAAMSVIYSHSFALVGLKEPAIQNVTFGTIGVYIFFILSGFLITASWVNHPRIEAFVGKRLLRIIPALGALILITVFTIGPLFTSLSIAEYFTNNETYAYLNGVSVFGLKYTLPGVFQENLNNIVNGPLWTLPYELVAYSIVALFGVLHFLKRKLIVLVLFFISVALFALANNASFIPIIFTLELNYFFGFTAYFIAGVIYYLYRNSIYLTWQRAFLMVVLITVSIPANILQYVLFFTMPYLVLYVGTLTHTGLNIVSKYGDFSYGMYIYAWLVQQIIVSLSGQTIGYLSLFILSTMVTMPIAVLSWFYIEKPALALKRLFDQRKYPFMRRGL